MINNVFDINSYDAVIFDLDGTLIDSNWVWKKIDEDFLGRRGFEVPDDYMDSIAHLGFEATADYTIKRFNLNETRENVINEWYNMSINAYSNDIFLKTGARNYLEYLKTNGKKMAIATASDLELVVPVLKNNNVYEFFHNITTIKEVSRGKGFPDIYIRTAEKLDTDINRCLVFEDILLGVKGARSGGFRVVGVYDKYSEKDEEKIREIADKYIYDFNEMEDL